MSWLGQFFTPQLGAGFGQQYNPLAPPPSDGREYFTGQIGADQYNQAGNVNNNADPMNGAKLGPQRVGHSSQLAGYADGVYSGYQGGMIPGLNQGGEINGLPLSGYYTPPTPKPNEPPPRGPMTPKPNEPPPNQQRMMGQWGGGGWNVGSGAPAGMQPMWLGSMNGGQNWAQAPSYNATAPQPGQMGSSNKGVNWTQAKNQDVDSPTWVQR